MLGHYLAIALRNLHRAPFTALINVATLALGLVAFVAAYAVVSYWSHSDRHFANADRTYVITASVATLIRAVNGARCKLRSAIAR